MRKSIYTKRQNRLCELLKSARKSAGLTQAEVARKLRTHGSYVSRYERGDRRLDVIEFLDVVETLGADPASILAKTKQ